MELWFDLGVDRDLLLKKLSFRQRADYGSPMTQVAIQGTNDTGDWSDGGGGIINFQFFNPSPTASVWTTVDINPAAFTKPYRYFRLIIPEGKTFLSVGELELYGTLHLGAPGSTGEQGSRVSQGSKSRTPAADTRVLRGL